MNLVGRIFFWPRNTTVLGWHLL